MMRQKKQLKLLLSMLAAMAVIYLAVSFAVYENRLSTMRVQQSVSDDANVDISLTGTAETDITEIIVDNGAEEISLIRTSDGWSLKNDSSFRVMRSAADELASAIASAGVLRTIEEPDSLATYGIAGTSISVVIITDSSDRIKLEFGDETASGGYYCAKNDSDSVYIVDSYLVDAVSADKMTYMLMESIPAILSPEMLRIEKNDGTFFEMIRPVDPTEYTYTDYYNWFTETEGEIKPLDRSLSNGLSDSITQLKWKAAADYDLSEEKIYEYGLKDPAIKAFVTDGEKNFTLLVGTAGPDNAYYAMLAGSDSIYTVDADIVEFLGYADYDTLKPNDICHINWDTVTAMDIAAAGLVHSIEITVTDDGSDGNKYDYHENSQMLDSDMIENFKYIIDVLAPVGEADIDNIGEEIFDIQLHRNTERFNELSLRICAYDDRYIAVRFNEDEWKLVSIEAANTLNEIYAEIFE